MHSTTSTATVKKSFKPYILLTSTLFLCTGILIFTGSSAFTSLFGTLNPFLLLAGASLVGFLLLWYLQSKAGIEVQVAKRKTPKELFLTYGLAMLFPIGFILVDCYLVYPKDVHILFPQSLLYYPVVGFIAEVFFHLLPFAFCFFLLSHLFTKAKKQTILVICIGVTSLAETIFQMSDPLEAGDSPLLLFIIETLLLTATDIYALWNFKKYGFITLYLFRIFYYLTWHIVWGMVRLELLF